jgi:pyruvate dehydrogenase E1 component
MQQDAKDSEEGGGSVYLRMSTRTIDQPQRIMTPDLEKDIVAGAYWLRKPGPNCELVIAYTGALAPEAIEATGMLGEDMRDIGLLAVTSADRLHGGWQAARRHRRHYRTAKTSHVERVLSVLPRTCSLITMVDGHAATLGWLGSVHGHRVEALGVDRFGQTGTIDDLYGEYDLDANAIIEAAEQLNPGRRTRHRKVAV